MYLLQLQQLQMHPTETLPVFAVARSEGIELLRELYFMEIVTPYEETLENGHVVKKCFRKGGPLEWYIAHDDPTQMFVDLGTKEERLEVLIEDLRRKVNIEWEAMLANTGPCNTPQELQKFISMENPHG